MAGTLGEAVTGTRETTEIVARRLVFHRTTAGEQRRNETHREAVVLMVTLPSCHATSCLTIGMSFTRKEATPRKAESASVIARLIAGGMTASNARKATPAATTTARRAATKLMVTLAQRSNPAVAMAVETVTMHRRETSRMERSRTSSHSHSHRRMRTDQAALHAMLPAPLLAMTSVLNGRLFNTDCAGMPVGFAIQDEHSPERRNACCDAPLPWTDDRQCLSDIVCVSHSA